MFSAGITGLNFLFFFYFIPNELMSWAISVCHKQTTSKGLKWNFKIVLSNLTSFIHLFIKVQFWEEPSNWGVKSKSRFQFLYIYRYFFSVPSIVPSNSFVIPTRLNWTFVVCALMYRRNAYLGNIYITW